jgi:hypothetical protein
VTPSKVRPARLDRVTAGKRAACGGAAPASGAGPNRRAAVRGQAPAVQPIPDIEELDKHTTAPDPDWIPITIRGIGEMTGDRTTPVPDPARSWIELSPFERDEYGVPRAYVHPVASPSDLLGDGRRGGVPGH